MPRILLCVDEPILADGFRSVISVLPEFELMVEPRPELLFERLRSTPCEIVVLRMAAGMTTDLLENLRQMAPESSIVLWTAGFPSELAFQAIRIGVKAVVERTASVETLAECIRAVACGERWFDEGFQRYLLTTKRVRLTRRQSELIRLVTNGLCNKEIARQLSLSEGTVRVYLSRLFNKVGVRGRLDLALHGLRNLGSARLGCRGIEQPLSPRERQIIDLLPRGLNNKEIAETLSISEGTVKVYLSHVFKKVGVNHRYELAVRSLGGDTPTPDSMQALSAALTQGAAAAHLPWLVMDRDVFPSPRQAPAACQKVPRPGPRYPLRQPMETSGVRANQGAIAENGPDAYAAERSCELVAE